MKFWHNEMTHKMWALALGVGEDRFCNTNWDVISGLTVNSDSTIVYMYWDSELSLLYSTWLNLNANKDPWS